MSDKELLERAAKAAGIVGHYYEACDLYAAGIGFNDDRDCFRMWCPLDDDGDALRTAAKLYLWEPVRFAHRLVGEPGCPDIYAATRRAIVRAAAAMADQKSGAILQEVAAERERWREELLRRAESVNDVSPLAAKALRDAVFDLTEDAA